MAVSWNDRQQAARIRIVKQDIRTIRPDVCRFRFMTVSVPR